MKTSLFLLLLSGSLAAAGSPPLIERWAAHLDVSRYDQMVGLGVDARGNIYVAGNTAEANGFGNPDVPLGWVVAKYTPSGQNVWVVRSPDADTMVARDFTVDAAGQWYLTGSVYTNGAEQLFAAGHSANGERRWERRAVAPAAQSYSTGNQVITDANGRVWIGGSVITNNVGFIYEVGGLLMQYDAAGNSIREQVEVLPNVQETAGIASLSLDSAGALLARIPAYPTNVGWEAFVVKYSPTGERLWVHETDVIDLSTFGKYPLAGPVSDSQGNVFLTGPVLAADFQIKVMKLDPAGNPVWHTLYSALHGGGSDVSDLAIEPDGSVIVTGNAGTAYIYDDFYVRDIVTLKYGADGTFRWLARGTDPVTPIFGWKLALDTRGNTYVSGAGTQVMKFNHLGQREWLVSQAIGPGSIAGLLVSRRGIVLGGSDELNSDLDLHVVNYLENQDASRPRFVGPVKVHDRGETVILEAKAFGRGRLRYQWFRDGLRVQPKPGPGGLPVTSPTPALVVDLEVSPSGRLLIPNVPANAGEYYVEVSNADGSVVSEVVRVGLPSLNAVPGE